MAADDYDTDGQLDDLLAELHALSEVLASQGVIDRDAYTSAIPRMAPNRLSLALSTVKALSASCVASGLTDEAELNLLRSDFLRKCDQEHAKLRDGGASA